MKKKKTTREIQNSKKFPSEDLLIDKNKAWTNFS